MIKLDVSLELPDLSLLLFFDCFFLDVVSCPLPLAELPLAELPLPLPDAPIELEPLEPLLPLPD